MSLTNAATSWPEQNAVEEWWEKYRQELKEAVTAERIRQMKRAEAAEQRAEGSATMLCATAAALEAAEQRAQAAEARVKEAFYAGYSADERAEDADRAWRKWNREKENQNER